MTACRMPGRLSDRHAVKVRLRRAALHTVCEEARCPNIAECFGADTATFLVLGNVCTRRCRFCAISKGSKPIAPDPAEPARLAATVRDLKLTHAVITSVTRDDLPDQGAGVFVACIEEIHRLCPSTTIEVLVPDFHGRCDLLSEVSAAQPDVLNHNIETVARLYPLVRPGAGFARSLSLLAYAAGKSHALVKSGLMVGLGERDDEVIETLRALADSGCRVVTIGQYLRPNGECLPVARRVSQEQFDSFAEAAEALGIEALSGPLVRSSYHASEVLARARRSGAIPNLPNLAVDMKAR